ncbi:MAG: YhbY family RNA-binding protein [Myxococcus sp.]|nr:YhbY family RNA-binding protein [Myxococcus sp.]
MALNGRQRRHLRSLGHHLHAVVQVGDDGVTEGVIGALAAALETHELVKVRIADDREGREAAIDQLAEGTGAEVAQVLGRTVLFFKRRATKPAIRFDGELLPKEEKPVKVAKKKKPKPANVKSAARRTPRSGG